MPASSPTLATWLLVALGLALFLIAGLLVALWRQHQRFKRATHSLASQASFLSTLLNTLPIPVFYKDIQGRYLGCNPQFDALFKQPPHAMVGKTVFDIAPPEMARIYHEQDAALFAQPGTQTYEWVIQKPNGERRHAVFQKATFLNADGQLGGLVGAILDITERKQAEATARQHTQRIELHNRVLRAINQSKPLPAVLQELVLLMEEQAPECLCSVLLLDEQTQRLHNGAAPSLPRFYTEAIEGAKIGDGAGSCGTAAYRGERVVVEDIQQHPYWTDYRELATQAQLGACWSQPFKDHDGRVLGTFAIYHRHPATPTATQLVQIEDYANLASLAVTRHRTDAKLRLLANVFTHAREGIFITDAATRIVEVNQAFTDFTGYSRAEVLGQTPRLLKSGLQDDAFYAKLWQTLAEQGHWFGELWNRHQSGRLFAEMLTISRVCDAQGQTQNYIALFSDITALKTQQTELERQALYDTLTNLPNRLLLARQLRQAMQQTREQGQHLAVVFLDLDGFKTINDSHGHEVGDLLLIALAQRMQAGLPDSDTLARIGGDEFIAILNKLPDTASVVPRLQHLLHAAADVVQLGTLQLQVSASIGVSLYPQTEEVDADQLVRQADQAMYRAKQDGKNRYHIAGPLASGF